MINPAGVNQVTQDMHWIGAHQKYAILLQLTVIWTIPERLDNLLTFHAIYSWLSWGWKTLIRLQSGQKEFQSVLDCLFANFQALQTHTKMAYPTNAVGDVSTPCT